MLQEDERPMTMELASSSVCAALFAVRPKFSRN
jgi:hypothetical protein